MKTQQVKPLPDTPAVIVNVFIKEEHHYHKGAVHLDFHDHFMAHLVSKLKFYLHISKKYCIIAHAHLFNAYPLKND